MKMTGESEIITQEKEKQMGVERAQWFVRLIYE